MSHAGLAEWVRAAPALLAAHGVVRGEVVALVLPPGPALAAAFITMAAAGVAAAPLNPDYKASELEFYFQDLNPTAVVVAAGQQGPAGEVARSLGLSVLELHEMTPAGSFELKGGSAVPVGNEARPQDVALILHTSGTTARPKMVPLNHANVVASARNIIAALDLSPTDCCLNVMPLFHIHGLIAGLLAPLGAGGSVYCPPGFNALKFFSWLEDSRASWYTAVPTMHQAILARSTRRGPRPGGERLRLVRSSSASLPPATMRALESCFGVPVLESYGMTEASHQIASNPLPPGERKPGSVGLPAGPQIRIRNEQGGWAEPDEVGEILIHGANVISGYRASAQVNRDAFVDDWFRTGDQGFLDRDGYLFITGRLKEIINRGGEKISPREVDDVLMEHPAVALAVTFAVPHAKLGEDVAAAVVLREDTVLEDRELKRFAAERLASFKVPRRLVFLKEIPKGPTGKVRRIGLAETLGLV
jgi:acyl-CoA synthetase (AMP-forming)/AMP-acid ligase II